MPRPLTLIPPGRILPIALLCCGALAALIINTATASTPAQETLTIRGRVVNGTAGFAAPGNLAVLMLITGPDGTLAATGQTIAAPDDGTGAGFVFDAAPMVTGGSYTLSVDYNSVFYGLNLTSEDLAGEPDDVVITVYEPTEDAGIIVVDRQVMVITNFDPAQRVATATEFVRFSNPTDRTLRPNLETAGPGMFSFMRFALPPEASGITVQSNLRGGEVISVGSGFALTAAVPPGEHSVDFAYTFPYGSGNDGGGGVAYRNSLPQGARIFQILIPSRYFDQNGQGIQISGLNPRPPVGIQEEVYRAWEGRDIPAGPGLQLRLDGLPQPGLLAQLGGVFSGGSFWLKAIPSAMGAVLLALLALGLARRSRPAAASPGEPPAPSNPPNPESAHSETAAPSAHPEPAEGRAMLVSAIAALDERYQQGGLDEADYLSQRAELTARALDASPYAENEKEGNDGPPC